MPRKSKVNLDDEDAKQDLLKEVYKDAHFVKNLSISILNSLSINMDYNDKNFVLTVLPLIQKQMEISVNNNKIISDVETRLILPPN